MENMKPGAWSIQNIWNEIVTEERQMAPREYIRGSEMGKNLLQRYLQMKGIPFTNHFEPRILRVFDCGHIFEEEVMLRIFNLLGLSISTQDEVNIQLPGLLLVKGHHDPRLGGKIDLKVVKQNLKAKMKIMFPDILDADGNVIKKAYEKEVPVVSDWMKMRVWELAKKLKKQYPNGLEDIITEMKTVNSMAFWAHKNQDKNTGFFKGYPHHKLQLWGYLKGKNHEKGRLFYISKDDLTLMEAPVLLNDKKLEQLWIEDVKAMTEMWEKGNKMKAFGQDVPWIDEQLGWVLPEWLKEYMPETIVWNENKNLYELNWEIGRSNYLTLLTGYENTDAWEMGMKAELKKKNTGTCPDCKIEFGLVTLNKNNGYCGKCTKKKEKI